MTLHQYLCCCITLCHVASCLGYDNTFTGLEGQGVTLPCGYSTTALGLSDTCWGRAQVPWSKCSRTIISTSGKNVDFRVSDRYRLLGKVGEGDVSLTIMNATEEDTGIYGCRVEIPGLMNDIKFNFLLIVTKAAAGTPKIEELIPLPVTTKEKWESPWSSTENMVRIGGVLLLSALTVAALINLRRCWRRGDANTETENNTSV